jgi:fatty-acyl-CoA synthase
MGASQINARHSPARWLADRARSDPGSVALEGRGGPVTYAELQRRAVALAVRLLELGLAPGDRVATVTENDPAQVVLFFACALARLVLVPLNRRLTPFELAAQLDVVAPSLVVGGHAYLDDAARAVHACGVAPALRPMDDLRAATVNDDSKGPEHDFMGTVAAGVRGEDPLLVVFTSGTTGRSKGAVLSHANCFWTNLSLDGAVPLVADDVVLQVLPQHHVGGWNVQPLQAWWKGATVVLEPTFDPGRVLFLVERRRITTMMGVPTTYLMLAEEPGFAHADLASLRRVVVGGAAMPSDLLEVWTRRGVAVFQGYGLTEASPNVLCLAARDTAAHPGSVGRPYGYVDVALHDAAGRRVEGEGIGELWVSGPNVFAGYWDDAAATAATMHGAWLRTGDLAERDAEGFFRICGRVKDLFVSGGENVYPAEVEAVLRRHPAVADAAVIGVADRRWGEVGMAFIQPKRGAEPTQEEVISFCRQRLAGFKVPRRVVALDALPLLASGKVDKRRLAAIAAGAREESGSSRAGTADAVKPAW